MTLAVHWVPELFPHLSDGGDNYNTQITGWLLGLNETKWEGRHALSSLPGAEALTYASSKSCLLWEVAGDSEPAHNSFPPLKRVMSPKHSSWHLTIHHFWVFITPPMCKPCLSMLSVLSPPLGFKPLEDKDHEENIDTLRETLSSVPNHHNKAYIAIKRVMPIFWFPNVYQSNDYTIL